MAEALHSNRAEVLGAEQTEAEQEAPAAGNRAAQNRRGWGWGKWTCDL